MASANIWITRMCVCHPKYLCLRIVVCVCVCAHIHAYLSLTCHVAVPSCWQPATTSILTRFQLFAFTFTISLCACYCHFWIQSIVLAACPRNFVRRHFPCWLQLSFLPYPCIAVSPAVLVVINFEEHMWLMRTVLMFDFRLGLVGSDRVVFNCHCSSYANFGHLQLQFGRLPGKPNKILIY